MLALAFVGVFAGTIAYIAYFGLFDDVGAIQGNFVFYAVPVVATLGGSVLLGESISTLSLVRFAVLGGESITDEL